VNKRSQRSSQVLSGEHRVCGPGSRLHNPRHTLILRYCANGNGKTQGSLLVPTQNGGIPQPQNFAIPPVTSARKMCVEISGVTAPPGQLPGQQSQTRKHQPTCIVTRVLCVPCKATQAALTHPVAVFVISVSSRACHAFFRVFPRMSRVTMWVSPQPRQAQAGRSHFNSISLLCRPLFVSVLLGASRGAARAGRARQIWTPAAPSSPALLPTAAPKLQQSNVLGM
jgi:hypothetical protein